MRGKGIGLVASGMIAGIFIGSHMVGAIGASAPCGTATPVATKVAQRTPTTGAHKIKLIYRYVGDTKTDEFAHSKDLRFRGPITMWAEVAPLDPSKVAQSGDICIGDSLDGLDCTHGDMAIDIGGKPIIKSVRATDLRCQFGCRIFIVSPENMKWDVRILQ